MSKNEGRRGFVRPQAKPQPMASGNAAWIAAQARYEGAVQANDAAYEPGGDWTPRPGADLGATAREVSAAQDLLLSTPAPTGQALAVKLAVFAETMGGAGFDPRNAEDRKWALTEGTDRDRAFLALYFDALALGGAWTPKTADADASKAVAAHAVAFQAAGDRDDDLMADFAAAERDLIATRAKRPINIAYKLRAAWIGLEPEYPVLDTQTVGPILRAHNVSAASKLIASAFFDLCCIAADQDAGAE